MNTLCRSSRRAMAAAFLGVLAPAALADERPGNLWQTTSQMVMQGVPMPPMPPQTMTLCTTKEWDQPPPPPSGQTCKQTDVQRNGNTITWKVACSGEMDMAGEGEITYDTPDSYAGKIRFTAEGVNMTVNLSGKKIDECDDPIG